jgi:hypothetical protein
MKVILSVHDEGYYVPDEGYSWHASCVLNLISTFLLLSRQTSMLILYNEILGICLLENIYSIRIMLYRLPVAVRHFFISTLR